MTAHDKLVQYLEEAHALEGALVQTLTAHIAMAPDGAYRALLEQHLQETRDHTRAIEERLGQLGVGRNPLTQATGIMQNVIAQAIALGKAPWDLVRGSGGEEKLLKNAKDEITSEAMEIATYDAIEALAEALGDTATAALARRHRAEEEAALTGLRALIPSLTEAVLAADVLGIETYEVAETGAAGRIRAAARDVRERAGGVAGEAREVAGTARTGARRAASRATSGTDDGNGGGTPRSRSGGPSTRSRAGTGPSPRSSGAPSRSGTSPRGASARSGTSSRSASSQSSGSSSGGGSPSGGSGSSSTGGSSSEGTSSGT